MLARPRPQPQNGSGRPRASIEGENSGSDVLEKPVDALEEVLAGHGAAPKNLPVVSLDAVEVEDLPEKIDVKEMVFQGLRLIR